MNLLESEIVLTVSEINFAIKSHIEPLFRNITIKGEISNLKIQSSGHIYFSLVDKESLIQAVLFRSYAQKSFEQLKNGDQILARGEISIYSPRGGYQLVVREIRPYGKGAELLRIQLLKKKLQELGWFNAARKKAIPIEWSKIGVITSPSGAVIQDIISVLERRTEHSFQLLLNPVKVQGENASKEIAIAIQEMNQYRLVDLLIVCRGGGSNDDLAAFNSEEVAQACFQSHIPIISAVGHETDTTILDLVADIRAATPSIAAEIASKNKADTIKTVEAYKKSFFTAYAPIRLREFYEQKSDDFSVRIREFVTRSIHIRQQHLRMRLDHLQALNQHNIIHQNRKKIITFSEMMKKAILTKQSFFQAALSSLKQSCTLLQQKIVRQKLQTYLNQKWKEKLDTRIQSTIRRMKERLQAAQKAHALLNPKNPLDKGYALIFRAKGSTVIDSVKKVEKEDNITIHFRDGTIIATVQEKNEAYGKK